MIKNRANVVGKVIYKEDNDLILQGLECSHIRIKPKEKLDVDVGQIINVCGRFMADELGCFIGKIREYGIEQHLSSCHFEVAGILKKIENDKMFITKFEGDNLLTITVMINGLSNSEELKKLERNTAVKIHGKVFQYIENTYVIKADQISYLKRNDQLGIVR